MNFEPLVQTIKLRSGTYVMVRPGLTLRLSYPEPIQTLGSTIAAIIEKYLDFIKPEALGTYLSTNGWKKLTARIVGRDLAELRAIKPSYEFVEYHYGHGDPSNVGDYGVHFTGSHLRNDVWPEEENLLLLQFPHDFLSKRGVDAFIEFVTTVASSHPFGSGVAGYGFHQLYLTFSNEAWNAIAAMAPRYIGFDIDSDGARHDSKGRVYNVSWLTLLGSALADSLGGAAGLRNALPESIGVRPLPTGVLLRAADQPIIGDVNRGADDVEPLRLLAQVTRPLRLSVPNLGPDEDRFAERWLNRFDKP